MRRELTRVEVLSRVKAGTLSVRSAATLLAVSYRQAKRLAAAVSSGRSEGTEASERGWRVKSCAAHGGASAGVGARAGEVQRAGGCAVRADAGRRASGERRRRHGASRHACGGGCWPRGCGVGRGNDRRIVQRRERKAHFGELVQLDGSFHLWYETRGPRGCLMNLVDDATGRTLARLGTEETIWAAVEVLRRWIEAYGVPLALYTDWKNVYVREPTAAEQATGAVPLTQFGRMCAALDIRIIAASSPQAKGRVERNHGTHQDRLVKKLRRLGIADAPDGECLSGDRLSARAQRRFARRAGVGRGLSSPHAQPDRARSGVPARGDAGPLE